MADIEITVDNGTSKRLLTAGKYCDKNILVTATGGGGEPEPPDDGKTRLYITVPANAIEGLPPPRNKVPLYIQQTVENGVTIDWGDGTAPETLPRTGAVNTTHTYEQAGDYVISLEPAEGCELELGAGASNYCVMGSAFDTGRFFCDMLRKVYIGKNVSVIGFYSLYYCTSLSFVVLNKINNIGNFAFGYCGFLASIVIPAEVTILIDSAFYNCYGMKEYHFLSPTPPKLGGARVFYSIPSDCIIYVPKGSAEAYKTATNWTIVADHIQEEPT